MGANALSNKIFKITNGVDGVFVENTRFNTTVISLNFYLPLKKETIAENALLPYVLTSSSEKYSDFTKLNMKLNMLYGADLSVSVNKLRDVQHIKIAISVINDEYAMDKNESVVSEAMELLLSLVFEPIIVDGGLSPYDTEREKRKQIEHILGEINDKKTFAKNKMLSLMFEGSPYGISKYGIIEDAEKITPAALYNAWHNMLNTSYVRVQVIGKALPEGIFDKIRERINKFSRENIIDYTISNPVKAVEKIKSLTERYEVSQGKLVMGFSSDLHGEDALTLNIMCDIFGGGPYSHLFENVREKMSLCYYCSAAVLRTKGLLIVQSGVEAENCEKAEKEILNQLDLIKQGRFSDFAFEASIKAITGSLNSYNDSLYALDKWYSNIILNDNLKTPESMIEMLKTVTREDIIKAANGIKLNTVYKLMPKEEK